MSIESTSADFSVTNDVFMPTKSGRKELPTVDVTEKLCLEQDDLPEEIVIDSQLFVYSNAGYVMEDGKWVGLEATYTQPRSLEDTAEVLMVTIKGGTLTAKIVRSSAAINIDLSQKEHNLRARFSIRKIISQAFLAIAG